MRTIKLEAGGHKWVKQNLVTMGKGRMYDEFVCSQCGIRGRSRQLGLIDIPERYAGKADRCPKAPQHNRLKVTRCTAKGTQFENLVSGSVHEIIAPPAGESNKAGEWVMGVGEPVLLLWGEFVYTTA